MKFLEFNGFKLSISKINKEDLLKAPHIINCLNPHSYALALRDHKFKCSLQNSTFLICDGIFLVQVLKIKYGKKIKKYDGPSLHRDILNLYNREKIIYVGGKPNQLFLLEEQLKKEFPKNNFFFHSPPFSDNIDELITPELVSLLNKVKPSVVFVGLGAPKQEIFIDKLKNSYSECHYFGIGAVFDFYTNKNFFFNLSKKFHLIWLYRLITDYKRIYPRVFISPIIFLKHFLNLKSSVKKQH